MSVSDEKIASIEIDILKLQKERNQVTHIWQEQRYKIVIERAASTKGVDGFKVEVNGDDFNEVQEQAEALYDYAKDLTRLTTYSKVEEVK